MSTANRVLCNNALTAPIIRAEETVNQKVGVKNGLVVMGCLARVRRGRKIEMRVRAEKPAKRAKRRGGWVVEIARAMPMSIKGKV